MMMKMKTCDIPEFFFDGIKDTALRPNKMQYTWSICDVLALNEEPEVEYEEYKKKWSDAVWIKGGTSVENGPGYSYFYSFKHEQQMMTAKSDVSEYMPYEILFD